MGKSAQKIQLFSFRNATGYRKPDLGSNPASAHVPDKASGPSDAADVPQVAVPGDEVLVNDGIVPSVHTLRM